jgi:hypothetical protein
MAAPVWVQAQPVELPATELGMLGQQLPGGIPRGAAWQSEDEVGVLGHYRHYGWTCHPLHRIRTHPPERSAGGDRNETNVLRR